MFIVVDIAHVNNYISQSLQSLPQNMALDIKVQMWINVFIVRA